MAFEQIPILELLWNFIRRKTENISKVTYFPQKPVFPKLEKEQKSSDISPESQGVESQRLERMLLDLEKEEEVKMHQITVMRHGKLLMQCGFSPYHANLWHASYSLCKSITGLAIGMLIDEGRLCLEDKLLDVMKRPKSLMGYVRQREIRIKHLLTMSSGVAFNEAGAVSGNDWVKGFLESPLHFSPGSSFEYNSMNSYMLSAVVTEITGETMMEYLKPRLWEPLGIKEVFWETCPRGITKGGWGLFLCPEDAANIGQLFLQHGTWNGKSLISEEWIRASTSEQIQVPDHMGYSGYGYQIWMGERKGSFVFNGMLGQNIFVYPDLDMVIVTNAGAGILFQKCRMQEILKKHFPLDDSLHKVLPDNPSAYRNLKRTIQRIEKGNRRPLIQKDFFAWWRYGKRKKHLINLCQRLHQKTYQLKEQHVGVFPLMMQVFHNNYTDGILKLGFEFCDSDFFVTFYERGQTYRFPAGLMEWRENTMDFHGEKYHTAVMVQAATDEDDQEVMKIEIAFLEDAGNRNLKIHFTGESLSEILVYWNETPGYSLILNGLHSVLMSAGESSFMKNLQKKGITDVLWMLVKQTMEPVTEGILETEEVVEKRL